jgi:GNAT superfamily N-acetyltransferase
MDRDQQSTRIEAVSAADPRAQECIDAYFAELNERFPDGFTVAEETKVAEFLPPSGVLLLVRIGEEAAGIAALKFREDYSEVKRMWIAPAHRGRGLGRMLLSRLEDESIAAGFRLIRLDTSKYLPEAGRLYDRTGYTRIPDYNGNPYAHAWYEKTL